MRKLTTAQFIEKAREVHGDKYDYSKVTYKGTGIHVDIICPEHGVFKQTPNCHTSQGCGCPICSVGGTAEERFWSKIDKNGPIVDYVGTPCWIWTGAVLESGYGIISDGIKNVQAHIFSYELHHGAIPRGKNNKRSLHTCHSCDQKLCCNPDHLFLGTNQENMLDASNKGRLSKFPFEGMQAVYDLYATGEITQDGVGEVFGLHRDTVRRYIKIVEKELQNTS